MRSVPDIVQDQLCPFCFLLGKAEVLLEVPYRIALDKTGEELLVRLLEVEVPLDERIVRTLKHVPCVLAEAPERALCSLLVLSGKDLGKEPHHIVLEGDVKRADLFFVKVEESMGSDLVLDAGKALLLSEKGLCRVEIFSGGRDKVDRFCLQKGIILDPVDGIAFRDPALFDFLPRDHFEAIGRHIVEGLVEAEDSFVHVHDLPGEACIHGQCIDLPDISVYFVKERVQGRALSDADDVHGL